MDRWAIPLGIAGSVLVLVYLVAGGPYATQLAIVLATVLPAGLVLYGGAARRRADDVRAQRALIEEAAGRSERADEDLRERVAELVTLNELAAAAGSTLDRDELLDWLARQPLLHVEESLGYCMVHAGLLPGWSIAAALDLAREAQPWLLPPGIAAVAGPCPQEPDELTSELAPALRARAIVGVFTRLRVCTAAGRMNWSFKGPAEHCPPGFSPWFAHPDRQARGLGVIFGHWAALHGQTQVYRQSLKQARDVLDSQFNAENPESRALLARIDELATQPVEVKTPDLGASLEALQAYLQRSQRLADPKAAAAPEADPSQDPEAAPPVEGQGQ